MLHPSFLYPPRPHQDGVRGVDGDLVIGGVSAGQSEVEVLDVEVHVRQDKLALDVVPGHAYPCRPRRGQREMGLTETAVTLK